MILVLEQQSNRFLHVEFWEMERIDRRSGAVARQCPFNRRSAALQHAIVDSFAIFRLAVLTSSV